NVATAGARDGHGTAVSGTDSATVLTEPGPHLTVTKSPSPPTVTAAANQIVYTVGVHNDGTVTLSGITVTDAHCPPVFASGDANGNSKLDVGETWIYRCT